MYVKGDRNSPAYYRIYQYFDKIENIDFCYHTMMSIKMQNRYMPISQQPIFIKIWVYMHIYFRMLFSLLKDFFCLPDVLIVHRRIISKYMPFSFRFLLGRMVRRGVPLFWDFDDHIIDNGEVSHSTFNLYAKYATRITVTHKYLKELIPMECQNKVHILPTTDGDMYKIFQSEDINRKRIESLDKGIVNLVWVATSVNLKYLEGIIGELDRTARVLKEQRNKALHLKVICNAPLLAKCSWLKVENIKWTREAAITGMKESHIGIMPLEDTAFTRGKGGFKLVQYLSIGLPCIGSNVGFNRKIITCDCGFLIETGYSIGWKDAILQLSDITVWEEYSQNAFKRWNAEFSYLDNLSFWKQLLVNQI